MPTEIRRYPSAEKLAEAAAEHFLAVAAAAIAARGQAAVMLSGGSTPRAMHARLAAPEMAGRLEWGRVHFFWGDERCLPPDHPDSNYRMARETLLDRLGVPAGNVHRIRGEAEPAAAADEYERDLRAFWAEHHLPAPRFDLIWLGLGDDGHTASLFPGTAAIRETSRWAAAVAHTSPPPPIVSRVTVTPAVINAAAQVTFLVSGAGKAGRLREVLAGPYQPDRLPAQIVRPERGRLLWMADAEAARDLPPET